MGQRSADVEDDETGDDDDGKCKYNRATLNVWRIVIVIVFKFISLSEFAAKFVTIYIYIYIPVI